MSSGWGVARCARRGCAGKNIVFKIFIPTPGRQIECVFTLVVHTHTFARGFCPSPAARGGGAFAVAAFCVVEAWRT